jgi:hypothetical protein
LRFCLRHEAVSSVIPGMRTSGQEPVADNCTVPQGKLSAERLGAPRAHAWPRNHWMRVAGRFWTWLAKRVP